MNYVCSECHKPIGLMADSRGKPTLFKCIRTGRVAQTLSEPAESKDSPRAFEVGQRISLDVPPPLQPSPFDPIR
jgi:hypothetical protein